MQRWDALAQARRRLDAWCAHVEASAHVPMPSKQQRAPAASEPHQSSSTQPLRQPRQPQRTTDHQPQAHESRAPTSSFQDHTRRHSRTMERDTVVHTPHEVALTHCTLRSSGALTRNAGNRSGRQQGAHGGAAPAATVDCRCEWTPGPEAAAPTSVRHVPLTVASLVCRGMKLCLAALVVALIVAVLYAVSALV